MSRYGRSLLFGVALGLGTILSLSRLEASEIHRLTIVLSTTSDSTSVAFKEAPFGAFIREVREGSSAPELWIRRGPELGVAKRVFDETRVTVEFDVYVDLQGVASPTLTLGIEKGWINSATVTLSNQNGAAAKVIGTYIHEGVSNPGDPLNRREFAVPIDKVREGGPRAHRSIEKSVLATYYPWFGTPDGPSGFWHQWIPGLPRYGSAHTPAAGFYDSLDPDVLRRHIREAHEAGIDGFAASWWGRGSFEDRAFQKLLTIAEQEYFTVSAYYENADTPDQVADDLSAILRDYGPRAGYLKVDGAPVIFIYGRVILRFGKDDWAGILARLNAAGLRFFLVADGLEDDLFVEDGRLDFLFDLFQGVHCYSGVSLDPASLRELNTLGSLRSKGKNILFAATVVPGYDDSLIRSSGLLRDRQDGGYFRARWETAVAGSPDWVLVTSWNEWHEGTEVEASLELGARYSAMTRDLGNVWNPEKRLRIIAGAGGTTDPAPGVHTYGLGQDVAVTANPDENFDFKSWSGDASGTLNPGHIVLDVNRYAVAHFAKIAPPLQAAVAVKSNRSLSQLETIHVLSWEENPMNGEVAGYRIYRIEGGGKTLLGETGPDERTFQIRRVDRAKTSTYGIAAISLSSREGEPAVIAVK